jgi:hypothetical protein
LGSKMGKNVDMVTQPRVRALGVQAPRTGWLLTMQAELSKKAA